MSDAKHTKPRKSGIVAMVIIGFAIGALAMVACEEKAAPKGDETAKAEGKEHAKTEGEAAESDKTTGDEAAKPMTAEGMTAEGMKMSPEEHAKMSPEEHAKMMEGAARMKMSPEEHAKMMEGAGHEGHGDHGAHGHGDHAHGAAAAEGKVKMYVCASDETTGLSYPGKCPIDGSDLVEKEVDAASLTDVGNTVCPVMGGAPNAEVYAVHKGTKVGFCCKGCDKTFFEDPEANIAKAKESAL